MALEAFIKLKQGETMTGNKLTNGNGSIMRLAAVPVFYHNRLEEGIIAAEKQSKVTH